LSDIHIALALIILILFSAPCPLLVRTQHNIHTIKSVSSSWSTIYENVNESKYTFDLNASALGIKLVLYMRSKGDINKDWVKIYVYSETVSISPEGVEHTRYIAGYGRFGYENDGKGSADGLHMVYYLLPNVTKIMYVEVKLHSINGSPRLDVKKSWAEPWNTTASYWMYENTDEGYGLRYGRLSYVDNFGAELKVAALSCGTAGYPCKSDSKFSFYYGRMFSVDSGGLADIYVDVNYVGGFNIAPESTYGKGNYVAKLDVGVATKGEQFTYFHTLYSTKKYDEPQLPELITSEVAKGVADIAVDIVSDYALEFITSPAGKILFKGLPYIGTIIEWAEMIQSFGFDEVVARSELVIFSKQIPVVEGDNIVYIWTNLVGELKSAWLSSTIMNFCGEPPWQSFMDRLFGTKVWRLDQGGVYIGGILLDYYNAPEIVSALPQGDLLNATSNITIAFSKPIDKGSIMPPLGSLYPQGKSIVVYMNGVEVPFYEYFRASLSPDGKTLTIYPNYHLDYGSVYRIVLTDKIRGADGTGLVKSYDLWFVTEKREQKEPVVYYVMPTATSTSLSNHLRYVGKIFSAQYENISIDLTKIHQFYVGEATFYTNDIDIDYYDGGSGRLYMVNKSLWFIPLSARDGGFPPKRGSLIFKINDVEKIIHRLPAQFIVSWVKVGNPNIEKSLRDAGVIEGALLDLEPVPVMNYATIASNTQKIGEGILISNEEPWINGTKLSMYAVTNVDRDIYNLDMLLKDYKSMYTVYVGGSNYLNTDIFVYIIVNATCMRAWRIVPLGYISAEEEKIFTHTVMFTVHGKPYQITLISNSSIIKIDDKEMPNKLEIVVDKSKGRGYMLIVMSQELGLEPQRVTIDDIEIRAEPIPQEMYRDSIGIKIIYNHTNATRDIAIYFKTMKETSKPYTETTKTAIVTPTSTTLEAELPSTSSYSLYIIAFVGMLLLTVASLVIFLLKRKSV
jgi:hypothetical protein